MDGAITLLFSYGTLRQSEVQQAVFGRTLTGTPDSLTGYVLDTVRIDDATVVETSGSAVHRILRASTAAEPIDGTALEIASADLPNADAYETADYARVAVTLASGRRAWVYVAADV